MSKFAIQASEIAGLGPEGGLRPRSRLDDQAAFGEVLARARSERKAPEEEARGAAEQLVATAFIGPVFRGLRESNNAAAPFKPNAAERSFGQMLDTTLAQRMVSSARWGLVDSVAQKLLKKAAGGEGGGAAPGTQAGTNQDSGGPEPRSISGATE